MIKNSIYKKEHWDKGSKGNAEKCILDGFTKKDFWNSPILIPDVNEDQTILDIGCGVAGIDLFLDKHYMNGEVEFFLLDKSHVEEKIHYLFEEKGAYYNSLKIAKTMLTDNGIDESRVHLIEATDNNEIKINSKVNLVLSLISWGFHYPVGVYLDRVYQLLNKGGILILDIRKNTDGFDLLNKKFGNYKLISERAKYCRVYAVR